VARSVKNEPASSGHTIHSITDVVVAFFIIASSEPEEMQVCHHPTGRMRMLLGVILVLELLLLFLQPCCAAEESENNNSTAPPPILDIQSIAERAAAFPMCDGSSKCNRFRYSYQGDCGNLAKPARGRWCRPDYDMDAVCCGDSPLDCCVLNGGGIMVTMLFMLLLVGTVTILSCSCCSCCPYHRRLNKRKVPADI
jgi:hypothetical protein